MSDDDEAQTGAGGQAPEEGAPASEPPKGDGPERLSVLERVDRFLRRRPVRTLALEHDFHVLPYSVSHSKRARRAIVVVGVAVLVLVSWYWVIPRTDAHLEVQYHEGLFNAIDVDARVLNNGNVELTALHLELTVTVNGSGEAMGSTNTTRSLPGHSALDIDAVTFKGDQITTDYRISVTARYTSGAGSVVKTFDFVTQEPFMNIYYDATLA